MSEDQKPVTREELEKEIIRKARADADFKKALMDHPKEALGRLGVQFPAEVEVKVVEESAKVVYLVLPVNPAQLTDEQLDRVAGGDCDMVVKLPEGCPPWSEIPGPNAPLCPMLDPMLP